MATPLFEVRDLHASSGDSHILKGVNLAVMPGEVHALVGPDGGGKSTLANALMGSPAITITAGSIHLRGDDITRWGADVRAKAGLFLAFREPQEIPGISVMNFLVQTLSLRRGTDSSIVELRMSILDWMRRLGLESSFADRHLNDGFSEGEKAHNEILQLATLDPYMAILDETHRGLDIDALRILARGVRDVKSDRPDLGVLAITRYQLLLQELTPDQVHILVDGRMVASGGPELATQLESDGYEFWRQEVDQ